MAAKCHRGEPAAHRGQSGGQADATGDDSDGAEARGARLHRPMADKLCWGRTMGNYESSGHASMAAMSHTMALPAVRGGVVPGAKTPDVGSDKRMGASVATIEYSPTGGGSDCLTRGERETALAMVALLVATSGLGCEDHESIRAWRNLVMCSRRMAGCVSGARAAVVLSRYGWWLRRWWTRASVAEARAAHDQLLRTTLGLEQRTADERHAAWRGLILEQRSANDLEMSV